MNQPNIKSAQDLFSTSNPLKIAVVSSGWHKAIVQNALNSIKEHFEAQGISRNNLELYEVPGAFELPLYIKNLAQTGKFEAIIACGFVVNGGIYRHDFVASAVIDGLMQVQLTSGVPVFSAVLTPHNFHEHKEHLDFFSKHFIKKGAEVAQACIQTVVSLRNLAKNCV